MSTEPAKVDSFHSFQSAGMFLSEIFWVASRSEKRVTDGLMDGNDRCEQMSLFVLVTLIFSCDTTC
jgi:hypothetical protein